MLGYLQLREPHPGAKAAVLNLPLVPCAPWERAPQASEPRARAFLSERPLELGPSGLLCSPGVTAGRHRRPHRAPTSGQAAGLGRSGQGTKPSGRPLPSSWADAAEPAGARGPRQGLRRGSAGLPGSSPDSTGPLPPRLPLPAPQHPPPAFPSCPATATGLCADKLPERGSRGPVTASSPPHPAATSCSPTSATTFLLSTPLGSTRHPPPSGGVLLASHTGPPCGLVSGSSLPSTCPQQANCLQAQSSLLFPALPGKPPHPPSEILGHPVPT